VRRPLDGRGERSGGPRLEGIDQPLLVDGRPVSFWHAVTGGDPAPTYTDLARLLAAFHKLGDCPCELSGFDPLRTSRSRLAAPVGAAAGERDFLRASCDELNEQLQQLTYALPTGPRSTETPTPGTC
jgi:hypothetical protein